MIELNRTREHQFGSSWTLYIRVRNWFAEVNFGRDLTAKQERVRRRRLGHIVDER